MALPPDMDFEADRSASPARMNKAMAFIDGRLKALEAYKPTLDGLFATLLQSGLDRIANALAPIYNKLQGIQSLGFLNAPIQAGSTATFALGAQSVTIADDRREAFTPSPWVYLISEAVAADYVLAKAIAYDQTTGVLQLNVTNVWGTAGATYSDVTVWGAPGGAISALESASQVSADRAAAHADKLAADASAAATAADRVAVHADKVAADAAAASAAASATAAATSATAAAASAASIAGGPVASIVGKTGVVTQSDVNAMVEAYLNSRSASLPASAGEWWVNDGVLQKS